MCHIDLPEVALREAKSKRFCNSLIDRKLQNLLFLVNKSHRKMGLHPYLFILSTRIPVHFSLSFSICDNVTLETTTFFSAEEACSRVSLPSA